MDDLLTANYISLSVSHTLSLLCTVIIDLTILNQSSVLYLETIAKILSIFVGWSLPLQLLLKVYISVQWHSKMLIDSGSKLDRWTFNDFCIIYAIEYLEQFIAITLESE